MNGNMTELVFILDRSGSMSGLEDDTIGGFNGMLKKQKEESDNINVTTVLFDDKVDIIHDRFPISIVQPLTDKDYYVRGCTALLDKIYLMGEDAPKDVTAALQYLNASTDQGNQYAQYTLGKLYLMGKDVQKDKETAIRWLTLSAAQGNVYAQFFLDHMDSFKDPSVLLAGTRLLHHMSRIFADNAPPQGPSIPQIDRKRRLKLSEKKRAAGHARGDHEQSMSL